MKIKYIYILLFCLLSHVIEAQISSTTNHFTISWKAIEKWTLRNNTVNVMAFDGAKYPSDNRIPYFQHRISIDKKFLYSAEIANTKYARLSEEEIHCVSLANLTKEFEVKSEVLSDLNENFLDINIQPIAILEGVPMKLVDFDLKITKIIGPQKVAASTRHTYKTKSVLSEGKFVRIKIVETGVYKLTFEDLKSMGVDPANVRIFGYGGAVLEQDFKLPKNDDLPELAIWMSKGSDGVFSSGDYVLFYAQGINKWMYDKSKSIFSHVVNSYSKYGYYFVTSDVGVGQKIVDKPKMTSNTLPINQINEFLDYKLYEKELVNLIGIENNSGSGKEFYGERFYENTSLNITFSFPNVVLTSNASAKLDVAASSTLNSSFDLSLDGTQSKTLYLAAKGGSGSFDMATGNYNTFTFYPQKDEFNFNLTYSKPSSTSVGFLNYLEVNARRKLKMVGSYMPFQNYDFLNVNSINQFKLTNANSNIQVWDITNPIMISKVNIENVSNEVLFSDFSNVRSQYLAIDPTDASSFPKPEIEGVVANQNLHGLELVDMVILTNPLFISQAEKLAQAHREIDNLTVAVVTTEQVYNEFSSGAPDATAYRWIMKMLYDRALEANKPDKMPKYLLLFGRGSFDNRKILPNSGDNLILTYQAENSLRITESYVSDDYFGFLDDNEGVYLPSNLLDIGIGRFPVSNIEQANDVVEKTIGYMNNKFKGGWKNELCFLADDGDGALHMNQSEQLATFLSKSYPAYHYNKIYLDAFKQEVNASGESYPLAKSKFQNLLSSGALLVNYTGHSNANSWSNEAMLTTAEIKNMTSKNLPLYIGATCDFLQYDKRTISGGEMVLLNPVGGGIGIFSAARPVYSNQNYTLNQNFCELLFKEINGKHLRLGDVVKLAKNKTGSESNKLAYVLMGDPALMLNYPTKFNVSTKTVNEVSSEKNDTLQALSVAKIEGVIEDKNGSMITNFNGSVHAIVYDKIQTITSFNNHGDGTVTFTDRPNKLFSGNAIVKDGKFSFSFMLPKDIKYNYGSGSINYYAQDEVNDFEAQGVFENFIVGGSNNNFVYESEGPEVQIGLNSDSFNSGDKVNETPVFFAKIKDLSGINAVGSGIGHDLLLTIDDDPLQSYVLNSSFFAVENSYTEGSLKYKLPLLREGIHKLSFKAFDLLNNSTTKTIEFEVVNGLKPEIFSVSNYPNPVKTRTRISVIHDRPETILNTTVDICDLSGRIVWSFTQSTADDIVWNLPANNSIKPGVYLYRVSIKTFNSEVYTKTNKMIVVTQ